MTKILKTTGAMAIAVTFAALTVAAPAFADECTDTIDMVTEASNSANLSQQDHDKVAAAKIEALNQQAAGDVEGCVITLAEAKMMLNLQ